MSFDLLGDVNWLAVIVGTLVYFALGAVWFMPRTFGGVWMRSIGWEPGPDDRPSPATYLLPLIGAFVATVALAMLVEATGADGLADGLVLGLVAGVGIAGAILYVTALFEPTKPRPMTWFLVTAGYHLAGILAAAVILSVW